MLDAEGLLRHFKFNGLPEIADELLMPSNEWRWGETGNARAT
jgi:hypothetical protein